MMEDNQVTRLYNKAGKHIASLLACGTDAKGTVTCVDLCLPSGEVLYCGVNLELVEVFTKYFDTENLDA